MNKVDVAVCLAFILCGALFVSVIYAVNPARVTTLGSITSVDVELSALTIDWGIVDAGGQVARTVEVRAAGNVPLASISMTVENWNPLEAESYLTVIWDYDGRVVGFDWLPVTFTLTVSSEIHDVSSFSFDIMITGSH